VLYGRRLLSGGLIMWWIILSVLYVIIWVWCIWELMHAKEVDKDDPDF